MASAFATSATSTSEECSLVSILEGHEGSAAGPVRRLFPVAEATRSHAARRKAHAPTDKDDEAARRQDDEVGRTQDDRRYRLCSAKRCRARLLVGPSACRLVVLRHERAVRTVGALFPDFASTAPFPGGRRGSGLAARLVGPIQESGPSRRRPGWAPVRGWGRAPCLRPDALRADAPDSPFPRILQTNSPSLTNKSRTDNLNAEPSERSRHARHHRRYQRQ